MRSLICIIVISLAFGCSPQKRLQRLVKNNPELLKLDTIVIRDTVVVEDYRGDTTTIIKFHDSTTVVNNEKIFLKYFYDTLTREIHHEYICLGDTIIQEKIIPYETIVIQELTWWQKYGNLIIAGIILLLVLLFLKKIGKTLL